jgi:hypothetical protein
VAYKLDFNHNLLRIVAWSSFHHAHSLYSWIPGFASERQAAQAVSKTLTTLSFPEEPLASSGDEGFGFFPACLGMLLNDSRYEILRKLGRGRFSSTWLASDSLYVYRFSQTDPCPCSPPHLYPLERKRGYVIARSKF